MTDQQRILVDAETTQAWVEVAHAARLYSYALDQIGDPLDGSPFSEIDQAYPFEKSSDWCRNFLAAAVDHLLLWADYAAPLKFHPDLIVTHTFRPVQTLSRAALESSAQAVWVMGTRNPKEFLQRHLRLVAHDLDEQAKAAVDDGTKEAVKVQTSRMWDRLAPHTDAQKLGRFPGYMTIVLAAAKEVSSNITTAPNLRDPKNVERLWRASAGSAHGKRWPSFELQDVVVGDEYEPDQHRTTRVPNPEAITSILQLAKSVFSYGVIRFADYCGYEPQLPEILKRARLKLAERITLKPGAVLPPEFRE